MRIPNQFIDQLKDSPLYHLFISSRELFHSNFWLWLNKVNSIETVKLFSRKDVTEGKISFQREYVVGRKGERTIMDVVVFQNNKPTVVIENKVKDFPNNEQLLRIEKAFNSDSNIQFVLATLFWTKEIEINFSPWNVLTYQELSERLVPEKFARPNSYHYYLINDYKNLLSSLASIANLLSPTKQYDFAKSHCENLFYDLNDAGLWEGYQKLRASHLIACFKSSTIYSELPQGIKIGYSVNNKKATLDFYMTIGQYNIGIQIEDKQFRRFINGIQGQAVSDQLLTEGIFFDQVFRSKKGNKNFLGYFERKFSYQYEKIDSPISFDDLFDKIKEGVQNIKSNQDRIENCISQIA